jgi:uncharacterized caspase-like protein
MNITLKGLKSLICIAGVFGMAATAQAPGDVRVALVIGNGAYVGSPLPNASNDAKAMGEVLRGLGFRVIEIRDGSKAQINDALGLVRDTLKGKQGIGMLYYAGHGLQVDARNYMVPIEAKLVRAADVAAQTVDVSSVINAFRAAGNRMNIVVLDACRDNPFGGITTGKGLAPLDAPSGTFLAYATAPGNVAGDGDAKSGNGLYTQYLLEELKKPQARIEDVFKRVRYAVRKASNGRQIPWESTSLEEDFQFNDGRVIAQARPTLQQSATQFSQEKVDWDRIRDSRRQEDIYAFLEKHPNGLITEAAYARLNQLARPTLAIQGAAPDGTALSMDSARLRQGDVYTERRTESGKAPLDDSFTVTDIDDQVARVTFRVGGRRELGEMSLYFAPDGAPLGSEHGRFDPPQVVMPAGPPAVGKTWRSAYRTATRAGSVDAVLDGAMLGKERITVGLGTFDTFRIQRNVNVTFGSGVIRNYCTIWVSPQFPLPLKQQCEDPGKPGTQRLHELVKYQPGPGAMAPPGAPATAVPSVQVAAAPGPAVQDNAAVAQFKASPLARTRNFAEVTAVSRMLAVPVENMRQVDIRGVDAVKAFIASDPFFKGMGGGSAPFDYQYIFTATGAPMSKTCRRNGDQVAFTQSYLGGMAKGEGTQILGGLVPLEASSSAIGYPGKVTGRINGITAVHGQPFPLVPGKRFGMTWSVMRQDGVGKLFSTNDSEAAWDMSCMVMDPQGLPGKHMGPEGASQVICYTQVSGAKGLWEPIRWLYWNEAAGCLVDTQ